MWYIEDLRPIPNPITVSLVSAKENSSQTLQAIFYGKCSKEVAPTPLTPYQMVFVLETGDLKCLGEYLDEGWAVATA